MTSAYKRLYASSEHADQIFDLDVKKPTASVWSVKKGHWIGDVLASLTPEAVRAVIRAASDPSTMKLKKSLVKMRDRHGS